MDTRQEPGRTSDYECKSLIWKDFYEVAERVGFEPTCRNYPTIRFRVGAVMTTSVPLRRNNLGQMSANGAFGRPVLRGWYSSGSWSR
jgi:hypothetical protein